MRLLCRIGFVVILITNCIFVYGQSNPVPGQIITYNSDTIETSISIENPRYSPVEIITGSGSGVTVYSPKTIAGFQLNGQWFVSAAIKREISPVKLNDLSNSPELFYVEDTVFLEVIVSGKKMLLRYIDNTGKTGFYIPRDEGYEWLVYKKYFLSNKDKNILSYNNNYIGQLILYLDGCQTINRVLSSTEYNLESLTEAFDYYFGCTDKDVEYIVEEKSFEYEISAMAGLSGTKLGFSGPGNEYLTESSFPWSVRFAGGAGIDLAFPNFLNMWTINNEVLYTSYLTSASYREDINNISYNITDTQLGASMIKLNNMFRGHLEVNYATIFLDLGLSNSFLFGFTNYKNLTQVVNNQATGSSSTAIHDLKTHQLGFIIGAGVKVNRISGFLRYELGGQIEKQADLDSKINSFYLMVSYKIL